MPARTRRQPAPSTTRLADPPRSIALVPALDASLPEVADAALAPQVVHSGDLRWADCPLYPGLRVGYRTNNKLQVMTSIGVRANTKAILEDPQRFLRFVASYVRAFAGWRLEEEDGTPIPEPTPSDPESYTALLADEDLMAWVCGEGYYAALIGGQTPNSARAS